MKCSSMAILRGGAGGSVGRPTTGRCLMAMAVVSPSDEGHCSQRCLRSDLKRFGAGLQLDGPGAAGAEAGRSGVAVLLELHVGHLPVDDLHEDRERELTTLPSECDL